MPARFRLIGVASHRRERWKNGQGWTTEIAADPPGAGAGDRFRWRLSLAEVEASGPFSDFAGYRRTIMLLDGKGLRLSFDGGPWAKLDRPFQALSFDGGARTRCELIAGPVRDFNLMVDASLYGAEVEVLAPGRRLLGLGGAGPALLHSFGTARLSGMTGARSIDLAPGDTLIAQPGPELALMLEIAPGPPLYHAALLPC